MSYSCVKCNKCADNVRLDRYIRRLHPNITQGVLEKFLRSGKIKLNGKKTKSNTRLVDGDEITVFSNDFSDYLKEEREFSQNIISLASKILSEYLLFSCEEFIAINKPHNLAVQGGSNISLSIDDAIAYINQTSDKNYKLVHRLDKDTSGILLIANGFENAAKLGAGFHDKTIKKIYIAMLDGYTTKSEGKLIHNIGKDRSGKFEIVKELEEGGKIAETYYKILGKKDNLSLVEFRPSTGRMHQLRFHAKSLGCPILGDIKYGGRNHNRMMLHAKSITVPKSIFGKEITISSLWPSGFVIT